MFAGAVVSFGAFLWRAFEQDKTEDVVQEMVRAYVILSFRTKSATIKKPALNISRFMMNAEVFAFFIFSFRVRFQGIGLTSLSLLLAKNSPSQQERMVDCLWGARLHHWRTTLVRAGMGSHHHSPLQSHQGRFACLKTPQKNHPELPRTTKPTLFCTFYSFLSFFFFFFFFFALFCRVLNRRQSLATDLSKLKKKAKKKFSRSARKGPVQS